MSCPGKVASSRGGTALLPQLPHPATRKGDCKALEVRGCTSQGAARCSAVRPATCVDSSALPRMSADEWRPATGAQGLKTDEVCHKNNIDGNIKNTQFTMSRCVFKILYFICIPHRNWREAYGAHWNETARQ